MAMKKFTVCALAAIVSLLSVEQATALTIMPRPTLLYSSVSPKLRIQTEQPTFNNVFENEIELKFTPALNKNSYNLSIVSETVISLALKEGKKWTKPATADGMTMYLTSLTIAGGMEQIMEPVAVATVIPTPTIKQNTDVIYQTGTSKLVINGTNFREKSMEIIFDPPMERNKDYIMSVKNENSMVLTRMTGAKWRDEPGPLKLKRINTGAGAIRVDPTYGGITVAEVQANLGAHGVTVESTPQEKFYQSRGEVIILGEGFNTTSNTLRFANSLRGKGVNYTAVEHTSTQLRLSLTRGSKWRANPENLPGPLILLAVNAGVGFVPVGPTEAKKGRIVATIFEDPTVVRSGKFLYQSHSHELWIKGKGFTRGSYTTELEFEPPLNMGGTMSQIVYNRTHIKISLFEGEKWAEQTGDLKVISINTGAGKVQTDIVVAKIRADADDHPSGLTVMRSSQTLYQTAAIRKLVIQGSGFTDAANLTFSPQLIKNVDYTQKFVSETKLILSLKKHKKWRPDGGALLVKKINVGGKEGTINVGTAGKGLQVATIMADPFIESSERIIFAGHTKKLIIHGSGFAIEGTELTLRPTPRTAYEIESIEDMEMVLKLNEDKHWAEVEEGKAVHISVQKIDTGAGEVIFEDPPVIAKVESDVDDNNCDDSCEWALDGICDDGSGKDREWQDDDYGGFYGYDDNSEYGYGYYYDGDDDFLAPVCEVGTDCTDCGAPEEHAQGGALSVTCDNSCQWANDGFCDDSRTSGLCALGTDCHDCGPVDSGNYTLWDDDQWWDDDDSYWTIDDTFDTADAKGSNDSGGGGSFFLAFLEFIVYLIGVVVCGGGTYLALRWYKGESVPNLNMNQFELLAQDEPSGKANVPITPDVVYT
jgi:hypothetical protein